MSLPILSFGGVDPPTKQSLPPFSCTQLDPATDDPAQLSLHHVARTVMKAKRVAVVCGAGISCASGIPDFRSSAGLFESLKKQHPEARLNSGKDLFDASLFSSEQNASIFYTMIAELKAMADRAQPTAFHSFLKTLDDEGKLFRVYTQNIDGLEEKAGLTYGLGDKTLPLPPRRASRSPTKTQAQQSPAPTISTKHSAPPAALSLTTKRSTKNSSLSLPYPSPAPSPPRDASPPPTHSQIPRCIPLHGHLGTVSCGHCSTTLPIAPYLPDLAAGSSTPCPKCTTIDDARASLGERSRGVGKLRPDVVLYGEEHKDGERVGEITRRDLMGVRPDLLLVVGTSLKVPGTKRLVRELAKVIRPTWIGGEEEDEGDEEMPSASAQSTSSSNASSRKKGAAKPPPVHVVYLNYEFPKPSSEWKDVFDVWMRGDVQGFVEEVEKQKKEEAERVETRRKEKELKEKRRVEREKLAVGGGKSTTTAGVTTKKAQATSRSKIMVPNNGLKSKTKTLGGAAKPRSRASITKASPPPPFSSNPTSFTTRTRSSRSPSATSTTSSTTTTTTTTTGRRTANSRSASVTSIAPSLPATRKQAFTLTFNVTKASVASVTGTKGRKG